MNTSMTKPNPSAVAAGRALMQEGKELHDLGDAAHGQGDEYYAAAGQKWREARKQAGWTGGSGFKMPAIYKEWLIEANIPERTEREAIEFAGKPKAHEQKKERQRIQVAAKRRESRRSPAEPYTTDQLAAASPGEIHEAIQGFRAAAARYDKFMIARDTKNWQKWRTVMLQHFKLLVAQSNLPALMNMSPEAIIKLLTI